jgi:hypothetical protein
MYFLSWGVKCRRQEATGISEDQIRNSLTAPRSRLILSMMMSSLKKARFMYEHKDFDLRQTVLKSI